MVMQSRRRRWARDVACIGKMINVMILIGKTEGKKPVEVSKNILEDTVKIR
jgi:hypothetical protein